MIFNWWIKMCPVWTLWAGLVHHGRFQWNFAVTLKFHRLMMNALFMTLLGTSKPSLFPRPLLPWYPAGGGRAPGLPELPGPGLRDPLPEPEPPELPPALPADWLPAGQVLPGRVSCCLTSRIATCSSLPVWEWIKYILSNDRGMIGLWKVWENKWFDVI